MMETDGKARKVDVRLPGKGKSSSHGARTAHLIVTMIEWIRTSRLSIKNSLSDGREWPWWCTDSRRWTSNVTVDAGP